MRIAFLVPDPDYPEPWLWTFGPQAAALVAAGRPHPHHACVAASRLTPAEHGAVRAQRVAGVNRRAESHVGKFAVIK